MLAATLALTLASFLPSEGPATFHRLSLDADALCAAGVTSAQVAGVVADLNESDEAVDGSLATEDSAVTAAFASVQSLSKIVSSGQATPAQVDQLATAKTTLTAAEASRQVVMDALFTAAIADLSTDVKSRLSTIRGNRRWQLPIEFLLVDRDQADWVALRDCLSEERTMAELEEPLDSTVEQSLATARANSEVAAAITRLGTHQAAVQTAWDTALTQ